MLGVAIRGKAIRHLKAAGAAGNLRTEVADTVMIWGGFNRPLELRLREVKIDGADGHVIARIPELAVGLSLRSLIRGRLALARLAVIGPTLHLERTADGRLMLDLDGAGTSAGQPPALVVGAGAATDGGPLAGLLAVLRQPVGGGATLTQVSILDAALILEDRVTGVRWSVPAASLTARRGDDGIRAQARIEMPTPGHPGVLEATLSERAGGQSGTRIRASAASSTASGTPALSRPTMMASPG